MVTACSLLKRKLIVSRESYCFAFCSHLRYDHPMVTQPKHLHSVWVRPTRHARTFERQKSGELR